MKQKLILKSGLQTVFIFLICFQSGCVADKHKYQAYQDMKDFVSYDYNKNGGYLLFFETDIKNRIIYIDTYDLQYTLHLSFKLNKPYFKDIMTGKIILSCEDLGKCLTLSSVIMNEYEKKGIEEFMKAHAAYNKENSSYTINPALDHDEKLNIAYCFYLNNIYTKIDNDTGYFVSQKYRIEKDKKT